MDRKVVYYDSDYKRLGYKIECFEKPNVSVVIFFDNKGKCIKEGKNLAVEYSNKQQTEESLLRFDKKVWIPNDMFEGIALCEYEDLDVYYKIFSSSNKELLGKARLDTKGLECKKLTISITNKRLIKLESIDLSTTGYDLLEKYLPEVIKEQFEIKIAS